MPLFIDVWSETILFSLCSFSNICFLPYLDPTVLNGLGSRFHSVISNNSFCIWKESILNFFFSYLIHTFLHISFFSQNFRLLRHLAEFKTGAVTKKGFTSQRGLVFLLKGIHTLSYIVLLHITKIFLVPDFYLKIASQYNFITEK